MRHLLVPFLSASILSSVALLAAPSAAQERDVRTGEVEVMDFLDGDRVQGDLVGPLGELIGARGRRTRQTLIRPRAHFQPEMLKSVEHL
ncbi:MAG: hypothetical protein OHK0013_26840 [Sandaracinaceae bacterium]